MIVRSLWLALGATTLGLALQRPPVRARFRTTLGAEATESVDCVVIGGGVSGLTTAFYAQEIGKASVLCAEASGAFGGVVATRRNDAGFLWEEGPNTFQASAAGVLRLAADLGIADRLVASDPKAPRYVFGRSVVGVGDLELSRTERLYALPEDLPALLGPVGVARAAAGALSPVRPAPGDESVAAFVDRVFGRAALEKVVDPFCSTVYTGDAERLSFRSVFPALADAADAGGGFLGLVGGLVKRKLKRVRKRDYGKLPSVPKGASCSFAGGLEALPDALVARLGDGARSSWEAVSVAQNGGRVDVCFKTPGRLVDGFVVDYKTVCASASLLFFPTRRARR